jgi:hypothetical protein
MCVRPGLRRVYVVYLVVRQGQPEKGRRITSPMYGRLTV